MLTKVFANKFSYCNSDSLSLSLEQLDTLIVTRFDCLNYGGEWVNHNYNYDSVLNSLRTLFILQSTEGWIDTMWSA